MQLNQSKFGKSVISTFQSELYLTASEKRPNASVIGLSTISFPKFHCKIKCVPKGLRRKIRIVSKKL